MTSETIVSNSTTARPSVAQLARPSVAQLNNTTYTMWNHDNLNSKELL